MSSFWQWGAHTAPPSTVLPQAKSSPQPVLLASNSDEIPAKSPGKPVDAIDDEYKDDQNLDYANDTFKEERVEIADPWNHSTVPCINLTTNCISGRSNPLRRDTKQLFLNPHGSV